jgi:Zn ribbon nucleic-acid-binding protein
MNCPSCGSFLELDSLEYRWVGEEVDAKACYSCPYCHQHWVKAGSELVKAIPVTEVVARKPYG